MTLFTLVLCTLMWLQVNWRSVFDFWFCYIRHHLWTSRHTNQVEKIFNGEGNRSTNVFSWLQCCTGPRTGVNYPGLWLWVEFLFLDKTNKILVLVLTIRPDRSFRTWDSSFRNLNIRRYRGWWPHRLLRSETSLPTCTLYLSLRTDVQGYRVNVKRRNS